MADTANNSHGSNLAPLLIGVTGKLDLRGHEGAVRAALDMVFDRLDARCPTTPKMLLSGLARGADTVAVEAALARPNWSVVGVLPFSEALFLEDFDEAGRAKFAALKAEPRLRVLPLATLRVSGHSDGCADDADLTRLSSEPHPLRADHYEQVGLFISERAAILVAVMEAGETPDRIGGAARIVHHRLNGDLDSKAREIVSRSSVMEEPPRLVERRTGPIWTVDLAALNAAPGQPAEALLVSTPGGDPPQPLGDNRTTAFSLALADALEGVNRHIADRVSTNAADGQIRAQANVADAASHLQRIRRAVSGVQVQIATRVRRSIWFLAGLSCAAILAFEIYVGWGEQQWPKLGAIAYPMIVIAAVYFYWRSASQRLQRFAEDYRALSESLRVQLVWWSSGLTSSRDRIERHYLRGAHGALEQLRILISALIDGALLQFDAPKYDAGAADTWVKEQIRYFSARVTSRRRETRAVEAFSWFLFAASLGVALVLAIDQTWLLAVGHHPNAQTPALVEAVMNVGWVSRFRSFWLAAATAALVGLTAFAIRPPPVADEASPDAYAETSYRLAAVAGLVAGPIITFALIHAAAMWMGGQAASAAAARELIPIAVVLPITFAGALRFVGEKSSWTSELTGYEYALDRFRRGERDLALAAKTGGAAGEAEHLEIVTMLGTQALLENENWLRSHRERPLEPVVGG